MRRGDEDDAADLGHGGEDQRLAEQLAGLGRAVHRVGRPGGVQVPQPRAAVLDGHLRHQAAHAVADEHHPVEGGIAAGRVEPPSRLAEGLPQQVRRVRDRRDGGVAEGPELVVPAQPGIGLEGPDHVRPLPRAAAQAVDEDHRGPARHIRPGHRQARRREAKVGDAGGPPGPAERGANLRPGMGRGRLDRPRDVLPHEEAPPPDDQRSQQDRRHPPGPRTHRRRSSRDPGRASLREPAALSPLGRAVPGARSVAHGGGGGRRAAGFCLSTRADDRRRGSRTA